MYPIRVIAHNIRSLWNVGSIFRSCDGFGVEKVYLSGYTGIPPRKEITKTALGADEFVPWEQWDDPLALVMHLQQEGWSIASLEQTEQSIPIHTYTQDGPLCLVLGNELSGVREDVLAASDSIVEIPMHGQKESFNVAVAAGIALFSLRFSTNLHANS